MKMCKDRQRRDREEQLCSGNFFLRKSTTVGHWPYSTKPNLMNYGINKYYITIIQCILATLYFFVLEIN